MFDSLTLVAFLVPILYLCPCNPAKAWAVSGMLPLSYNAHPLQHDAFASRLRPLLLHGG